jgi:hypothetical protein
MPISKNPKAAAKHSTSATSCGNAGSPSGPSRLDVVRFSMRHSRKAGERRNSRVPTSPQAAAKYTAMAGDA